MRGRTISPAVPMSGPMVSSDVASAVKKVDIAGSVCETGDILAADRELPLPKAGDLAVILDAGAYGFSMASEYNARPMPAEVLVKGDSVTGSTRVN